MRQLSAFLEWCFEREGRGVFTLLLLTGTALGGLLLLGYACYRLGWPLGGLPAILALGGGWVGLWHLWRSESER